MWTLPRVARRPLARRGGGGGGARVAKVGTRRPAGLLVLGARVVLGLLGGARCAVAAQPVVAAQPILLAAAAPAGPTGPAGPAGPASGSAANSGSTVTVGVNGVSRPSGKPSNSIVIMLALTVLSVAPALLLLCTSLTKIFVVVSLTPNPLRLTRVPP